MYGDPPAYLVRPRPLARTEPRPLASDTAESTIPTGLPAAQGQDVYEVKGTWCAYVLETLRELQEPLAVDAWLAAMDDAQAAQFTPVALRVGRVPVSLVETALLWSIGHGGTRLAVAAGTVIADRELTRSHRAFRGATPTVAARALDDFIRRAVSGPVHVEVEVTAARAELVWRAGGPRKGFDALLCGVFARILERCGANRVSARSQPLAAEGATRFVLTWS